MGGCALWQSEIYDASDSALRKARTQKAYSVVNLMARYVLTDHLSLTATLDNLFDKEYRTYPNQHDYGPPRNFMLTAKYQF